MGFNGSGIGSGEFVFQKYILCVGEREGGGGGISSEILADPGLLWFTSARQVHNSFLLCVCVFINFPHRVWPKCTIKITEDFDFP